MMIYLLAHIKYHTYRIIHIKYGRIISEFVKISIRQSGVNVSIMLCGGYVIIPIISFYDSAYIFHLLCNAVAVLEGSEDDFTLVSSVIFSSNYFTSLPISSTL